VIVATVTDRIDLSAYSDAVSTSEKPLPPNEKPPPAEQRSNEPPPPPVAVDPPMVPFAVAGIVAWAVAGLALLPFQDTLTAHGHGSWLAICLAGFLWGFVGLAVMLRHDANRRRRRSGGRPS
jgi:Protein of unknown function (DUF2530)